MNTYNSLQNSEFNGNFSNEPLIPHQVWNIFAQKAQDDINNQIYSGASKESLQRWLRGHEKHVQL
ncbi:hypothetical protein FACS189449_08390 [Alphaproteobacteria bacterium]|nr:hypothetical protein FACS189449_08390 [Alphaproteobacteria bacterium]